MALILHPLFLSPNESNPKNPHEGRYPMTTPTANPTRRVRAHRIGMLAGMLVFSIASTRARATTRAESSPEIVTSRATNNLRVPAGALRVEVDGVIDDAELIPGWVEDRNHDLAEQLPEAEGHEQWIAVQIAGVTYDYDISIVALRDGRPVGKAMGPSPCECANEEMLVVVDAGIAAALEQLRANPPKDPVPVSRTSHPPVPPPVAPERSGSMTIERQRRTGPLGYSGIAVTVLGAGALGSGILLMRQDDVRGAPGSIETRPTRKSGIGLAVGGGVALGAGLAIVVVDLVRRRNGAVAVTPILAPRQVGVSLTRKF